MRAEAEAHVALAEEALRQNRWLLKWRDPTIAALEFTQAGTKFGAAQCYEDQARVLKRAAELHAETDSATAGRSYENAGAALEKAGGAEPARECYVQSAEQYRLGGKAEAAARVVLKAAAIDRASGRWQEEVERYELALEIYGEAQENHLASEVYRQYIGRCCNQDQLEFCLSAQKRYAEHLRHLAQNPFAHKEVLAMVVCCLAMRDSVRAERCLDEGMATPGFATSAEEAAAQRLLAAVQSGDQEAVDAVTKAGTVTFLQSDVARLAQRIRVAGDPGTAGPGGGPAELGDLIA